MVHRLSLTQKVLPQVYYNTACAVNALAIGTDLFVGGAGAAGIGGTLLGGGGLTTLGLSGGAAAASNPDLVERTIESATAALRDPNLRSLVARALENVRNGVREFFRDGDVWRNAQGQLPTRPLGYYREFTVATQGGPRGVMRLVVGEGGEVYFTPDHYTSFVRIQ